MRQPYGRRGSGTATHAAASVPGVVTGATTALRAIPFILLPYRSSPPDEKALQVRATPPLLAQVLLLQAASH